MNISILGGAFNPPHLGHLWITQQVLDFTDTDQVWLTTCYRHTFDKYLAPVKDRVVMTKMLIVNPRKSVNNPWKSKIRYCNEEINNRLSGETIELMTLLRKRYPQHCFSFIIGSDNLVNFKRWGQWKKLITSFRFYIFPRPGFSTNLSDYGLDHPEYKFTLITNKLLIISNLSSTIIRSRIKHSLSIDNLVPMAVKRYIDTHNLYR